MRKGTLSILMSVYFQFMILFFKEITSKLLYDLFKQRLRKNNYH